MGGGATFFPTIAAEMSLLFHHKEKPIKIVQSYNLLKDQIKLEGRIIFKIKFSFHQVVHREFIS